MVAKNYCLMKLRDKGKLPREITERMIATPAEEINLLEHIQKDELITQLEIAMPQLNAEQRLCIEQFYLHKKSYLEITESSGYTLMQVKSHIQNGKRNLKLLLQKQLNHER